MNLYGGVGHSFTNPFAAGQLPGVQYDVTSDRRSWRAMLDLFEEVFGSEDRLTQAVTLFALLELHRKGEATWDQREAFGPIQIRNVEVGG